MTLQEFVQRYPQYATVPPEKLAEALHRKFYPDMDKSHFYPAVGLKRLPFDRGVSTVTTKPFMSAQEKAERGETAVRLLGQGALDMSPAGDLNAAVEAWRGKPTVGEGEYNWVERGS